MSLPPLPRSSWSHWLHNVSLRVGVLTGVSLAAVMVVSLVVANRVQMFENFAGIRNAVSWTFFALAMLIPIGRYLNSPAQLFASGVCGWFLFTLAYGVMGFVFENLHSRLNKTPFHVFILGAAFYGLVAVVAWVASMVMDARRRPIGASRRRPY